MKLICNTEQQQKQHMIALLFSAYEYVRSYCKMYFHLCSKLQAKFQN